MPEGRFQVNVFNTSQGAPLPDATVSVRVSGEGGQQVEEMLTDISGQTITIELPAPPVDYSLQPEAPRPYSDYDITVTQEGFESVTITGIQILANTIATQSVILQPSAQPNLSAAFFIPDHTLYGEYPPKTPEDEVKPRPPATGFVVLPLPVVPEFIVVHDGVPSDTSAPNYWVPYKEYIKNVASNEIYATWPVEALRANILAIISFTLSRVYTEWYRNQGYEFTITSSTAYDQKFVYQRNLFEEISHVVDDVFNTYITRPGIEQPLFTQYCDGQRSSCPGWLSQWGSKEQAAAGSDYMAILRSYYGTDIYLAGAEEVEGVPVSFPGSPLQVGSTGASVRTVQQQLNAVSNNYPAIQKVAVTGMYDEATRQAVETFQGIFKMPQTGVVDRATWYELSRIYVAVMRLA